MFADRFAARPVLAYVMLAGLAVIAGLLETAQSFLRALLQQRAFSWPNGLLDALPSWLLLALLVPAVVAIARHVRLDRDRTGRAIAIHAAAALAFALAHQTLMALLIQWRFGDVRFVLYLWKLATIYLAVDIVVYWGVVGGYYAVDYARELRRRELSASRLEASLSEARLQALRAQLNPHFLFNTLNAISVLAMKGDGAGVTETLSLLSDLLRLTLDGRLPQEVPLAYELALTDRYLEIQRVRFPDRMSIERDVTPEALDAMVPSLVLQPLIENAVVHGVAQGLDRGRIVIRAARDGGDLKVQVCDTGPGFPATAAREGIGLANTRARLAQLYGAGPRLICSNRGPGACAEIIVPYRTGRDSELIVESEVTAWSS